MIGLGTRSSHTQQALVNLLTFFRFSLQLELARSILIPNHLRESLSCIVHSDAGCLAFFAGVCMSLCCCRLLLLIDTCCWSAFFDTVCMYLLKLQPKVDIKNEPAALTPICANGDHRNTACSGLVSVVWFIVVVV